MSDRDRTTESSSIYILIDPRDGCLFYVGRTCQLIIWRLSQHIRVAREYKDASLRSRRIREILADGWQPIIEILEVVPRDREQDAEESWVEHLRSTGIELVNQASARVGGTQSHLGLITPEIEARLGTVADAILAEEVGITRKAISYHRRKKGIPASYDRSRMKPPPPMGAWNRTEFSEADLSRLGTVPDYVLAEELGSNKATIARIRRARGIRDYATSSGNDGKYRDGHFPTRWLKHR